MRGRNGEFQPPHSFEPAYLRLARQKKLAERAAEAREKLKACDLCARYCRVDRLSTTKGAACHTGERAVVSSYGPHHGEESPLSGRRGSGTIFFAWCSLRCVYCQNSELSWEGEGSEVTAEDLAEIMLKLQAMGCHNINFVSPSHVVASILEAVTIAAGKGLTLPLVYNTGGYDSPEALALLDGVIDIYMPDMKYGDDEAAAKYSRVSDYAKTNRAAVREMHRQVGNLILDEDGIARRGLLVRHLVLPEDLAGSAEVFRFLAEEISAQTYLNVMAQYRPCYRAGEHAEIARRLGREEFRSALRLAADHGLMRLDDRAALRASSLW